MKRVIATLLLFTGCRAAAEHPDTGCGGRIDDPLASILVASAELRRVSLWQAGLVVGHAEGDARLVVTQTDGTVIGFDARLDGQHAGLVMDASTLAQPGGAVPLELPSSPATPITARDLLGTYSGPHAGLELGLGGQWRDLRNDNDVRFTLAGLALGVGATPVTWESIELALWDDPAQVVFDEDDPGPCLFCSEGEGEGEDECGARDARCGFDVEGAPCCDPADVCVPFEAGSIDGVCRRACADDASVCDDGSTCQHVTAPPTAEIVAVACLAPTDARDEACFAARDDELGDRACADGLDCRPAAVAITADGDEGIARFACKQPCDPVDVASVAVCTAQGEECLPSPVPLDGAATFECAARVPVATAADVDADGRVDEAHTCNEASASRYCDRSMFDTPPDESPVGDVVCLAFNPNAVDGTADDGFCFAACSFPAVDGAERVEVPCAAGWTCDPALGLATGVVVRTWEPCTCADGPCPDVCGADGWCDAGACVGLIGSCRPE